MATKKSVHFHEDVKKDSKQKPQPKWFVLQVLNFVVLGVFVSSVSYVGLHYKELTSEEDSTAAKSPLTSMFFPLMVLWTFCLAYFFGFFGISFVDKDALHTEDSAHTHAAAVPAHTQPQTEDKAAQRKMATMCAKEALPARDYAPAPALSEGTDYAALSDEELLSCLVNGSLKDYQLEKKLGDYTRAVAVRRSLYEELLQKDLDLIPYEHFDYNKVFGANCEIVVGYVPIPLGVVGPLVINGESLYVPMATTEGCLVASTNRGCKALTVSGGCSAVVLKDAITRAPCVRMPSAVRAAALKKWVSVAENYAVLEKAFNSTTSFGRLESIDATVAGRNVYLRFACMSGDAMGMNMVSKGCLKAMDELKTVFPDMELIAISGNMCTDKKPAAINWILGRGKSVVVEAVVSETVVQTVLKSSVKEMIETNRQKNHIGSAMAGSVGGFNAHAANIVTAVYLATGQDPAQNVESSNCLTIMELAEDGKSLHVSVTMPSIEVGTVGGGTHLPAQAGCLEICGVRGASKNAPGDNSRKLATIVGSAVLAGELSLIAALAANHLVNSHMQHNRKPQAEPVAAPPTNMARMKSMPNFASTQSAKY